MSNTIIKTSIHQSNLEKIIIQKPDVVEIILFEEDMYRLGKILKAIEYLKEHGTSTYIHQPYFFRKRLLDFTSSNSEVREFYIWSLNTLEEICHQETVNCIACSNFGKEVYSNEEFLKETIKLRKDIEHNLPFDSDYIFWEVASEGLFSRTNPYFEKELAEYLRLKFY